MKGFYNRLLFIDVGEKTFTVQPIEDDLLKKCLGGKGLASFLLLAGTGHPIRSKRMAYGRTGHPCQGVGAGRL